MVAGLSSVWFGISVIQKWEGDEKMGKKISPITSAPDFPFSKKEVSSRTGRQGEAATKTPKQGNVPSAVKEKARKCVTQLYQWRLETDLNDVT